MINEHTITTPAGALHARWSERGLQSLVWAEHAPEDYAAPTHDTCDELIKQLAEYFRGERRSFTIALDPTGTPFQHTVWTELARIPYGETRSYREQADAMGRPDAIRAVASANGRNPISIIVPCHRVIGSDGSLTGYAGGLDAKRLLLELEARHSARTRP